MRVWSRRFLWLLAPGVLVACGGESGSSDASTDVAVPDAHVEPPLEPDLYCPGMAGCPTGDGQLEAGAAAVDITPDMMNAETFTDLDGDAIWDPEEEPFEDRDGDGRFDGVWIAGFGVARAARGVMNPQWARALVLRAGDTAIAFVALDVVGWFLDEIELTRAAIRDAGLDVDYVVVGATHTHQARDTIGIWGPSIGETGLDPAYQARVRDASVQAVREAWANLRAANIQYASFRLRDLDSPSDVYRYVGDARDPIIIDDEVRILRFVAAGTSTAEPGSGTTIATLVNFASHPEYQGSKNPFLSSDWPHWMRAAIENGIERGPDGSPVEGVGGTVVFFNGALGVQIGPHHLRVTSWDGTPVSTPDERAATVGTQLGYHVLRALRGAGTLTEETASLALRRAQFFVTVQNRRYHIASQQGLFSRRLYHYDETRPIREPFNLPDVLTEIAVVDVGRATLLTVPGELDPAEFVGGYEPPCEWTPGGCDALIDEEDVNPPDLSRAPTGPFLRDRLAERRPDASQIWVLGCTNDFLGYFIPDFDYQLSSSLPYLLEAPGDHYEETNSIGPLGWPRIRSKMHELIDWTPP
jgi:hypothetical protein